MSPSNPANHTSRPRQQTVLLACDNKNSVLAEMAGCINHVAYSPYGQQSAQQKVMTHLGFNGELREVRTDWYFLGNGYRVYNPLLMRFHSPDSLSPFREGGLNMYAYCGCEPVMNVDPTGRNLESILRKIFDFFSLSNTSSGPVRNTLPVQTGSGESGLLVAAGGIVMHAKMNKRPPIKSVGGNGRRHAPPSWKGSQNGHHSTTTPRATTQPVDSTTQIKSNSTKFVLEGNYGKRPQNEHSKVKTRDGVSISGTDSGTRQFPSNSRGTNSSVSEIRGK